MLVYSAYVAEVYRAGIESVHPSQEAAARSLGLSRGQSLRYVILPQAVRRVLPPLLNDFIGLQKDTALVGLLGPVEAFEAANIAVQSPFNYTPYFVAALLFIALDDPDGALHRLAGRPPAAPPADGAGGMSTLVLESVYKTLRRERGAEGHRPGRGRSRGGVPDRGVGLGQVDAAALRQPDRADRLGPDHGRRSGGDRARRRPQPAAARDRDRLPVLQPVSAHDGDRERLAGAAQGAEALARRRQGRRRSSCSSGSGWPTRPTPTPTICPAASSSGSRSCGRWR